MALFSCPCRLRTYVFSPTLMSSSSSLLVRPPHCPHDRTDFAKSPLASITGQLHSSRDHDPAALAVLNCFRCVPDPLDGLSIHAWRDWHPSHGRYSFHRRLLVTPSFSPSSSQAGLYMHHISNSGPLTRSSFLATKPPEPVQLNSGICSLFNPRLHHSYC